MSEYGALKVEQEVEQVQSFKKTVVLAFAGLFVVGAVVGLSAVSSNATSSAVNANRNKGQLAAVPGVMEKTQEVLNMTSGDDLRYAIFSFTPCCENDCGECKIVPTVQGQRSADWAADWKSFNNALPEDSVAAAVYNFEYFTGESSTANKPILITWAPPQTSDKQLARAGYYLGSVILATDGVSEHYPLQEMGEGYMDFCTDVLQIDSDMCAKEGDFHNCPFENDAGLAPEGTPCDAPQCDGAAFTNPDLSADEGTIPDECCAYIKDYCANGENMESPGCHPVTLRSVTRLCAIEEPDETPDLILPEDEEQLCTDDCMQPCAFFESEDATWQKCSACPTDGLVGDAGFAAQCYPGAIGFKNERCCGIADECNTAEAASALACDTLEDFGCVWLEHNQCPEELAQQTYDAAPIGCCDGEDAVNQLDCEGEFAEGECPEPVVTEAPVDASE